MKFDEEQKIDVLKAVAHPVRLEILRYLDKGPSCATLANKAIPVSQPNLSQHLKSLKAAGLIDCCNVGTKHCYYVCRPSLVKALLSALDSEHPLVSKDGDKIIDEIKARN